MRHSIRSNTPDDFRPRISLPQPLRVPTADGSDPKRERAVLVCVLVPNTSADLRDPLGELAALAESAGTVVMDAIVQKRPSLSPSYALGKGKLADLVELVETHDANVVIFDNELTPRQIRGIEKAVNRKVIDRAELILDIFAKRAKTRESQLQVELAQLQYTAPRLRGLWTHLERIAGAGGATAAGAVGGVGTRGPGERQIEIDRRIVQKRISHLKNEIQGIDRRKLREAPSRAPVVCLLAKLDFQATDFGTDLTGVCPAPAAEFHQPPETATGLLNVYRLNIRMDDVSLVPTYTYPFDLVAEGHRSGFNSGRQDLNLRLPAPKAGALPGCATPRSYSPYRLTVAARDSRHRLECSKSAPDQV